MPHQRCLAIPRAVKDRMRFMFLAKHALGDGTPHPHDGTHAVYHYEMLQCLRGLGLQLQVANSFSALHERPDVDFMITLLNRAGFRNSEMMAPLFGEQHRLPYWGGAPMVRGLSDDKHFMKRIVQALDIPTPEWSYYPIGGLNTHTPPDFTYASLIVKPNASSASWGVAHVRDWEQASQHIAYLHQQGHDAIVEKYIDGIEINAPVIGAVTPWHLPVVEYRSDSGGLRSYEAKRDLVKTDTQYVIHSDTTFTRALYQFAQPIVNELWPFDHGRLEFRVERDSGKIWFIEVNLNCNLWSRKAIATAARHVGVSHPELIETILCHSLLRQGLIAQNTALAA